MRWSVLLLAVLGCESDNGLVENKGTPSDPDPLPVVADTDTDADADSDSDADTDADTDTQPGSTVPVRFVAIGDAGEGNDDQYAVADAIKTLCDVRGCDFALYLGDNFYDSGVDGVDDTQWDTKFENVYANIDFPFYPVLGNHDLGLDGLGVEFWLSQHYVNYTQYSAKWTMVDEHYTMMAENVMFYALDTTKIFFALSVEQETWIQDAYANTPAHIDWRIGMGHHPYISNGRHGNAGNYEGIASWVPLADIPRGDHVKDFFDANICGQVDMYISGHDHNRQWLEETCGTTFIVSGAGAKTTDLEGRGNFTLFEDDQNEGFLWVEIIGHTMTGAFYNKFGDLEFESTYTK